MPHAQPGGEENIQPAGQDSRVPSSSIASASLDRTVDSFQEAATASAIGDLDTAKSPLESSLRAASPEAGHADRPSEKVSRSAGKPDAETVHISTTQNQPSMHSAGAGNFAGDMLRANLPERVRGSEVVSSADSFSAIDAPPIPAIAKWTLTGTHQAEAGFQDPALGWVAIRAQGCAGVIHAAIVPSAPEAAQVLGEHLAGLNAHMAHQSPQIGPISIAVADAGTGQTMNGGEGQSSQQRHQSAPNTQDSGAAHPSVKPFVASVTHRDIVGNISALTEKGHQVSILV